MEAGIGASSEDLLLVSHALISSVVIHAAESQSCMTEVMSRKCFDLGFSKKSFIYPQQYELSSQKCKAIAHYRLIGF